jgi:DNA repair protein RadC
MITETLFSPENVHCQHKSIKFKVIRAVFDTLTIREAIPDYLDPVKRFTSSQQVFETFSYLRKECKEHFIALHLDGKNRIACIDRISVGSLNQSIVHPREVFKTALLSSAAALLLIHNHPSGDPTPSREDLDITRRLKEAGELLGISILDHIIIGDTCVSLSDRGLL